MRTILLAALPVTAMTLIFGFVVLCDRLREPHRDPTRPMAVVDARTYRDAQRRIERLIEAGDTMRARHLMHAICLWLRDEVHTGRQSRRANRAADLEQWELRLEQIPLPIG
ncbi:hypothetical protein [Krasilnikovia sp. MM14-A1259]|uniref:hypothetical protein n=1 Tax=Krasilnikovia sp. MM14-A1259 TaxID=3373539 RepID=UPI0037FF8243